MLSSSLSDFWSKTGAASAAAVRVPWLALKTIFSAKSIHFGQICYFCTDK
jgi:hypothetical protein